VSDKSFSDHFDGPDPRHRGLDSALPADVELTGRQRRGSRAASAATYAVDWQPGRVDFFIDGQPMETVDQSPDYPMQMMVAVFDFPDKAGSSQEPPPIPELAVDHVRGPTL